MDRETKTFTLGEHTVVMNAYMTGKENNAAKASMFTGVTSSGETGEKPKIPLENVFLLEKAQLTALVISIDGVTEAAAIERLQSLPSTEYDAIVAEIKKQAGLSLAPAK